MTASRFGVPCPRGGQGAQAPYRDGARDLRLDFLRGYALFVMTLTHLGMASPLIFVTGGSRFLINAAEAFFFISGYTIGYIARGRALAGQVRSRLSRSWLIYRYVLLFTFALSALLGLEDLEADTRGEAVRALARVVTMKEALWEMDILVAYVIYVALAPLALWGLHQGRAKTVAATIAAVYLLAQIAPLALSLEFASFRHLAANSPLFFGAIVGGYHSRAWTAWWRQQPWSRAADAVIVAAGLLGLAAFLTDYGGFARVEAFLGDFIVREQLLPPHNLAIICLYLRILWLLVTRFWGVCARIGGWLFLPLGRDGLLTYCLHVTYIELFRRWAPPLAWEETVYLQLLAEAIVVGLIFASVLAKPRLARWLHAHNRWAQTHKHWLNSLVWSALALLMGRILVTAEPGGWWWERGDVYDFFDE